MSPDDRARIEQLLQDPSLSYRAIGRELGLSDWSIRRVARELANDPRPMKQRHAFSYRTGNDASDVSATGSWIGFGVFVAVLALAIWTGVRYAQPFDPRDFSNGFYSNPSTERRDDETEYP